jgi:hypothetical protein
MIKSINVRFFIYCLNEDGDVDTCEITEAQYNLIQNRANGAFPVDYIRHTVRENGVSQICLTIDPDEYPNIDELERA